MSVGFGFSVGDFIAVLKLVGTVIDALRESSSASTSFRSLTAELCALETALLRVKRLNLDDAQTVDIVALRSAATQCQTSINGFYHKIRKYQPHLQQQGTNSKVKDAWMKVKWTVCEKDDVDAFRAEIRGHTGSLEILLMAMFMESKKMQERKQDEQHKTLGNKIQQLSGQILGKLSGVADSIAHNIQQGKLLLEYSAGIVHTNLRIFQLVRDVHLLVLQIPGQVQRQQPVYFVDPYNKESPFHLEFVRSAEALLAIMKVNLKDSGCGPDMIDRGEYVIEEQGTHNAIDITMAWDMCFYPGQKVAMSMVFQHHGSTAKETRCPRCTRTHEAPADKAVTCNFCGTIFRRIEEMRSDPQEPTQKLKQEGRGSEDASERYIHVPAAPRKEKLEGEDSDTLANLKKFRRIQLISTRDVPDTPDTSDTSDILGISYIPDKPSTHRRSHVLPVVLTCPIEGCRAQFRGEYRQSNLARHSRLRHSSGRGYPCEGGCDKIFGRQDARLKHYRRKHPDMPTLPPIPRPRNGTPTA